MLLTQFGFTPENVARFIRATGPGTLVIDLPEPRAISFVLNCLSANAGGIVERAAVLAHEQDGDLGNGWLKRATAGAGSYRINNWVAAEFVTLTANPRATTRPRTSRITIRHLPEPASQYLQLSNGDIDIARDLGADEIRSLAGNASLQTVSARQGTSLYIAANRAMPELARPQVAQALKWAIDYEGIARTITPQTWVVEQSFLPQGLPGALGATPYRKDVARARDLLAQAGLADGFAVTMDSVTDSPQNEIAQVIQANLREIGIRVELLGGSTNQVITKTRSRNFQLALQRWSTDYLDANSNAQWFSQNADDSDATKLKNMAWRCHFADAELTAQSLAAVRENHTARRLDIYRDMQRAVLERAPFIFLLQRTEIAGLRRAVSGLTIGVISDYTQYAGITKA
jgi:peptide/nickel transport system substrate-binding protein